MKDLEDSKWPIFEGELGTKHATEEDIQGDGVPYT